MIKTIIAVLVAVVAIALTVALVLGGCFLVFLGGLYLWGGMRKRIPVTPGENPDPPIPFLNRRRSEHSDAVTAIAYDPSGDEVVSAGRDRKLQIRGREWDSSEGVSPAFYPGPIAVGYHEENGMRLAVGRFRREDADPAAEADIEIWEHADLTKPFFSDSVADLSRVIALAFGDAADDLYGLISFRGGSSDELLRGLRVLHYDLRSPGKSRPVKVYDVPGGVPLHDDHEVAALSRNGHYVACRTEHRNESGEIFHGVGVWDVFGGKWKHRIGGREAEPHRIYAVTKDGDTVFSGREDDPGRDYKFGGTEWYDGLYIWDAASALPEGTVAAQPSPDIAGGRIIALDREETLFAVPAGASGRIEVYDLPRRQRRRFFHRPHRESGGKYGKNNVWCAAFSPDGKELATGFADGEIWFWDVTNSHPL